MCLNFFKICKSPRDKVQNAGKQLVFAPCGYCEECKNMMRYGWAWRITSDLQYYMQHKQYASAFVTLTYNDEHLPHFPSLDEIHEKYVEFCVNHRKYKYERKAKKYIELLNSFYHSRTLTGLPSFDKEDTEKLILYIRKVGFRKYHLTDILYFLASEFGPSTQRPHYHMLISWDKTKCTSAQIHELIRHYWVEYAKKGFITPNELMGGKSRKTGKKILPFEIGTLNDALKSAYYTAKYVTKDAYFMKKLMEKIKRDDLRYIKQYLPHHRQTLGLGSKGLSSLCDDEKIALLKNGRSFLGENHLMKPPSYICNKLVYSPKYIIDPNTNKRLVKRELTEFFKRNFEQIITDKLKYYETLFSQMADVNYWSSYGLPVSACSSASSMVRTFRLESCSLAEAYVFYYGINYHYCFTDKRLTFFNRYRYPSYTYSSLPLIPLKDWMNIKLFFTRLLSYCRWQVKDVPQMEADLLRDEFNKISYEDIEYAF